MGSKKRTTLHGIVAMLLVACLMGACSSPKQPAEPSAAEAVQAAEPAVTKATIVMTNGDVQVRVEEAWKLAEIGDELPVSSQIKTGAASSCDLVFGNLGAVRIGAESIVDLRRITIDGSKRNAELSLIAGSVACKVSKLMQKDSFEVRTRSTVCGVRGTEFVVRADKDEPTVVAVQEGKVALLPPSFDSAKIEALASTQAGETVANAVIERLSAQAPIIQAGEESVIGTQTMATADAAVIAVVESLAANIAAVEAASSPQPVPNETETTPMGTAQNGAAPRLSAPATPTVPETPSQAEVAIPRQVLAALDKYGTMTPNVKVETSVISVESKKDLMNLPQPLPGNPEAEPDRSSAAPPPAEAMPTSPAAPEQTAPVAVVAAKPPKAEDALSLAALPGANFASGLVGSDAGIFAADSKGRLISLGGAGKMLWSAQTDNGANTNSRPVACAGKLYYAGDAKLAAFDVASGRSLFSQDLNASDSGIFGRRPLVLGNQLYLSSDSGLEVFDAASGARISTIDLPEGSDMTPSAIDSGDICLVTRNGVLCVVDVASGKITTRIATKAIQPIACSPLIVGQLACFADRKGLVTCVDLGAGTVKWSRALESGKSLGIYQDPEAGEKALYFYTKSGIYGISLSDGAPLFAPIRDATAAPCLARGKLWYGTAAATVVGADPESGKPLITITCPSPVTGKSVYVRDKDAVLFPTAGGILALDLGILDRVR